MLVTNLLFSHGFTVTHRSFIQDYVMIFQIIIHLRSIRMKRFYVSERLWFFHQNYTENIHKFNGRSTKNAFAGVLQRRFYFIVCAYELRTLVQSRSE